MMGMMDIMLFCLLTVILHLMDDAFDEYESYSIEYKYWSTIKKHD